MITCTGAFPECQDAVLHGSKVSFDEMLLSVVIPVVEIGEVFETDAPIVARVSSRDATDLLRCFDSVTFERIATVSGDCLLDVLLILTPTLWMDLSP
jgi:hypothetical protein